MRQAGSALRVGFDGTPFFDYVPEQAPRPHIDALYGPGGVRVTRDIADAPAGSDDHGHHKGVWWGHREVNGADVWTEFEGHGSIVSVSPVDRRSGDGVETIIHSTRWLDAAGAPLLEDTRTLVASAALGDGSQTVDVQSVLRASGGPVVLADTKEAGLVAVRVTPALEERRGGRIELSTGAVGENDCWGRPAEWCDYSGIVDGVALGIAIFDSPGNRLPASWHVRDYGLMAVNPFGLSAFSGEPSPSGALNLGPGESLESRYRVLVHRGDAASGDVAGHYARYRAELGR
jgi:hypothetical protein